jgi:RND family efflux transporter MFP subunit
VPDVLKSIRYLPAIAGCLALAAFDAGAAAVNVKTATYADLAYYPEHATAAEVIARYDSKVSAEITAIVSAIDHDTGDRVNQGDTIVSLDCRTYELQLQQAQAARDAVAAQYENAKKLFASARKLQKQNNISQELYNQRDADAARLKAESINAKAGVVAAEIAVENCAIRAPYDGYISERFISKGELVQPGTAVFQIVTSAQGRVDAHINTSEYESFIQGIDHRFVFNGTDYALTIDSILPVLDRNYRTHTARLSFVGQPAPTGSHGELKWRDTSLALPSSLVVLRDGEAGVLVANSDKASFMRVDHYIEGQPAYIALEADTRIITTGRHGLKDGDTITVTPAR